MFTANKGHKLNRTKRENDDQFNELHKFYAEKF